MLPFMKHSKEASVSVAPEVVRRKSDDEGSSDYDHVEAAAEDLHNAIKSGNIKAIAEALRSAFYILDSEPHEEGPHIDE